MCEYIKDDGEQCGMDGEPFCHHHDDTDQAALHAIGREMFDGGDVPTGGQFAQLIEQAVSIHSEDVSGASDDFLGGKMGKVCDDCGASLRRVERLTEHPNRPRRVVFEVVVKCDCNELTLGSTSVSKSKTPDGWQ